jgi:hypothetical protein
LCLFFLYAGCSGGGGGGGGDPCAGPVPCLTTGFGNTFYEFIDNKDDPVALFSDGVLVGFGGFYYDADGGPYTITLVGMVVDCHNGDLTEGAIDWNDNGEIEDGEVLEPFAAEINICNSTLSIYNIDVLGPDWQDYEATYVGAITLSLGSAVLKNTDPKRKLVDELFQSLSIE